MPDQLLPPVLLYRCSRVSTALTLANSFLAIRIDAYDLTVYDLTI